MIDGRNVDDPYPAAEQRRLGYYWDDIPSFGTHMNYWSFYRELVRAAPPGSTLVEVGCYCGQSLVCLGLFAREANKGLQIVGVDNNSMGEIDTCRKYVRDTGLSDIVRIIGAESVEAAKQFADNSIYAAFIDAGHLHDLVEADCRAWMPKVQPGGWLAGHDFVMWTVHGPVLNLFRREDVIYDQRWDDIWIVPKMELIADADIWKVPEKYPERTTWHP